MEICGDNRFEIIAKAKAHLLDATNIDTAEDEMNVLDSFLYRCWQMGWLDRYDEQTEPNSSEKPNNCEECEHWNDTEDGCADRHGCKTEPQTDCLTCRYNSDEWDSPKCDGCSKAHSNYEPQTDDIGVPWTDCQTALDEPQTDCAWR